MDIGRIASFVLILLLVFINNIELVIGTNKDDPIANLVDFIAGNGRDQMLSVPYNYTRRVPLMGEVNMKLLNIIDLDVAEKILTTQLQLAVHWTDNRAMWNPAAFKGISTANLDVSVAWTPDLALVNSAKVQEVNEITPESNFVTVHSDGVCSWRPRFDNVLTRCDVDITRFPFDRQTCEIIYQSLLYDRSYVDLTTKGDISESMKLDISIPSDEWDLVGRESKFVIKRENRHSYARLIFTLHLRRKALYYMVNFIVPSFLLSILAVVALLIPPSSEERLGLSVTILLTLTVYQLIVDNSLPVSSKAVPVIGIFFLFVILLCVVCVIATVIVKYIDINAESAVVRNLPAWVKTSICQKLAAFLRFTPLSDNNNKRTCAGYQRELRSMSVMNGRSHSQSEDIDSAVAGSGSSSLERHIVELVNMLRIEEERKILKHENAEEIEKIRNEWKLAAAVIDRLFFVIFTVIFVIGMIPFFILASI